VKHILIALVACCVAPPLAMGQAANVVNSSRSNIKNNLAVSQGPDGKTHCTVANKPCAKEDVDKLNAALAGRNAAADPAAAKAAGSKNNSDITGENGNEQGWELPMLSGGDNDASEMLDDSMSYAGINSSDRDHGEEEKN